MREIKFRAWNGKEILYGILPWNDNAVLRIFSAHEIVPATVVMQYTGLKDKNGLEIYEGDIIKHEALRYPAEVKHGDHESGADDAYSINDYGFYGKSKAPNWDGWFDVNILSLCDGDVIGNIYENPELLTFDSH